MTDPTPSAGFLDQLRIAKPCSANWADMSGDERTRFCKSCEKNVYDLRFMTREEAEALLRSKGEACVRMARRADGTVVTSDCPVGVVKAARRQRVAGVVGGGLLAASALLWKVRAEAAPTETHVASAAHSVESSSLLAWVDILLRVFVSPSVPPAPPPPPAPEPVMMGAVAVPQPPPPPPPTVTPAPPSK